MLVLLQSLGQINAHEAMIVKLSVPMGNTMLVHEAETLHD
jgi:hypothetical protein